MTFQRKDTTEITKLLQLHRVLYPYIFQKTTKSDLSVIIVVGKAAT